MHRPPPAKRRQRQWRLPALCLAGAVLFAATVATLYTLAGDARSFRVVDFVRRQPLRTGLAPPPPPLTAGRRVWWHAPFFSGSGMGVEALQLVLGLQAFTEYRDRVWVSSHGDLDSYDVFAGMPSSTKQQLVKMVSAADAATTEDARQAVIVCHSEPGAWALPEPLYQTSPCPPVPLDQAAYVVARAMFETDRISPMHAARCNRMSEVWVPTQFHRGTFQSSGVDPSKLFVVPEAVDVEEFDPSKHSPLPLPMGTRVFGPAWPHPASGGGSDGQLQQQLQQPFVFLSIFKWETRKGWDVLLRAFLTTFTASDNVLLLLMTKPYHSSDNFAEQMEEWARQDLVEAGRRPEHLPSVYVLGQHVPQRSYPRLFKSADCFVLPTRGEGWGLPVVEAMAMALPVIVTNWSGPTGYLDDSVGYPLRVEELVDIKQEGAFQGHRWAQPSAQHLSELMRHVVAHRQEAAARGRAARRRMASHFSPDAVAEVVAQQLRRIERKLAT